MKKIMLFTGLLVIAVLVVPSYAQPLPKAVEVVNPPENPVPVQGSVDVTNQVSITGEVEVTNTPDVNVVNPDPIPISGEVTITDGAGQKTIVSAYTEFRICLTCPPGPHTVMNIPVDKQFILTDIFVQWYGGGIFFYVQEDDATKLSLSFAGSGTDSFHFNSGIPFAPGTSIKTDNSASEMGTTVRLTISGYQINN